MVFHNLRKKLCKVNFRILGYLMARVVRQLTESNERKKSKWPINNTQTLEMDIGTKKKM